MTHTHTHTHTYMHAQPAQTEGVYWALLQGLCCVLLFCAGNVLKTLLAKLLSSHFYKASYFAKMQDALRKARAIV